MSDKLAIVVPTLNEAKSIGALIENLMTLSIDCKLIIVDDKSEDNTSQEVLIRKEVFPGRIHLIIRKNRVHGLAGAYLEGYLAAKELGFNWIIQMDADGQHSHSDVIKLWELRNENKVIIGSRYCTGGKVTGWGKFRLLISKLGNLYFRLMHNTKTQDCTGGFRLYSNKILDEIWLKPPTTKGFTFHAESTYRCIRHEVDIVEVPINFKVRSYDKSKMNFWSGLESLYKITQWRYMQLIEKIT